MPKPKFFNFFKNISRDIIFGILLILIFVFCASFLSLYSMIILIVGVFSGLFEYLYFRLFEEKIDIQIEDMWKKGTNLCDKLIDPLIKWY